MKPFAQLLQPNGEEMQKLAVREMDPAHAREFEQLCPGPALTIAWLLAICVCAVIVAPFRIVARLRAPR